MIIKEMDNKFKISNYLDDSGIFREDSGKALKEIEIINAVETYLKVECYESYKKNNLKEIFNEARENQKTRLIILNSVEKFAFKLT